MRSVTQGMLHEVEILLSQYKEGSITGAEAIYKMIACFDEDPQGIDAENREDTARGEALLREIEEKAYYSIFLLSAGGATPIFTTTSETGCETVLEEIRRGEYNPLLGGSVPRFGTYTIRRVK